MKEENINTLDEIHKGTCMGIDAIEYTLDKTNSAKLEKLLNSQLKEYKKMNEEIEEIYPKYNDGKPHETNIMTKTMTWFGIEMKTMFQTDEEKEDSKIAELMMQGTNMGIIEGRKILNKKNMDKEVEKIVEKYVDMQERYIELLKEYL